MTDDKKLPDRRTTPPASNATEHIYNLFKAGLAGLPGIGGPITSLMSDYIPSRKMKRLEEFVAHTSADLRALERRVNSDTIRSDEFAYMFEQCLKGVNENYQAEKIAAFRGILLNSAIGDSSTTEDREHMLSIINRLSVLHLKVLAIIETFPPINGPTKFEMVDDLLSTVGIDLPGKQEFIIRGVVDDLYQAGLVSENTQGEDSTSPVVGAEPKQFECELTEYGQRFIDIIKSPVDA